MGRCVEAIIDLQALAHNLQQVRVHAPRSKILAMVKSNAYGHGIAHAVSVLKDADALGVACLEEALEIRALVQQVPIVLMEGFFEASELAIIARENFAMILHQSAQLDILEKSTLTHPIQVWLKIDTGMHRLGFRPEQVVSVLQRLQACTQIIKPIGLMTHFAESDDLSKDTTQQQLHCFNEITKEIDGVRSLANSAAILHWPQTHADWVRPGIMLYGASPFVSESGHDRNLRPVMQLRSHLIDVRRCYRGERIGYNGRYQCPEDMMIGVVAIGYGDGYPRHAGNGTPVLVNNTQVSLVGAVSMDMITVDLRACPQAKMGDPVTLWGHHALPAETVAMHANTIAYQLFCGITKRVKFRVRA